MYIHNIYLVSMCAVFWRILKRFDRHLRAFHLLCFVVHVCVHVCDVNVCDVNVCDVNVCVHVCDVNVCVHVCDVCTYVMSSLRLCSCESACVHEHTQNTHIQRVCACVRVRVCTCVCVYVCACVVMCVFVCLCLHAFASECVCMCTCEYV